MGRKKEKVKEECCEKYKKSGKYCKDCPLTIPPGKERKDKNKKKRKDKQKNRKGEKE